MNSTYNGKQIKEVWFAGDGNTFNERKVAGGGITLELSATFHGDHEQFWIIVKADGMETERINPRYASSIVWLNP